MKTTRLFLVVLLWLGCGMVRAQTVEFYGGYTYQRMNASSDNSTDMKGWTAGAQVNLPHVPLLLPRLAVVADFSGAYTTLDGVKLSHYTCLVGPRITEKLYRVRIYEQALVGRSKIWEKADGQSLSSSSVAGAVGIGMDVDLSKHVSLRLLQADYLFTRYASETQNNVRCTSGLVWRF